jgi:Fe2+ or Zn2+ uptake regulation protein
MPSDLHQSISARIKRAHGRYTPQRRELVNLLYAAHQPLTIEQIRARAPHLAQSSLYRNLTVLEATGAARRFTRHGDQARFELDETLTGHHHHFVCSSCGAMTDVELPHALEDHIESALHDLAGAETFEITSHRLDVIGRCHHCT